MTTHRTGEPAALLQLKLKILYRYKFWPSVIGGGAEIEDLI